MAGPVLVSSVVMINAAPPSIPIASATGTGFLAL